MNNGYATEQEAIDAATGVEVDEFDGQNCNDLDDGTFCSGWDGVSYRCDCGNRRVSLATYNLNGRWYAYAAAY